MNTFSRTNRWLVLAVAALATTVYAQKEQWLGYHTSREGRGFHYLEMTTNPPPNVALPKLNARPYFARWVTPMDPAGGRWLCLDRTRKSGPYDRLYFDSNGNGRLDDKAPISAARLDQYNAYFDPARVVFKGEDGPITYHLVLRFMQYEGNSANLLVASGGFYAGQVELGGKKRKIEILDGNVNGTFNDQGKSAGEADRVQVENDKNGERYLGKLLEVDGQFYRIEVARDGAFVKLQPAKDVVLGKVRVPETISSFNAYGDNGHFSRKPVKGEFTMPVGKYQVLEWSIDRKDNKGAAWQLMGYSFKQEGEFQVAAEQPAAVKIGEPLRAVLEPREGTNRVDFQLSFQGPQGESIQIMKGNQRPAGPKLTLASADGIYRSTNTFEFG
jgi:hypothetical protein